MFYDVHTIQNFKEKSVVVTGKLMETPSTVCVFDFMSVVFLRPLYAFRIPL